MNSRVLLKNGIQDAVVTEHYLVAQKSRENVRAGYNSRGAGVGHDVQGMYKL